MTARLLFLSLLVLSGCDRYLRTNPYDPEYEGPGDRGDGGVDDADADEPDAEEDASGGRRLEVASTLLLDAVDYGPRNNENGRLEAGETVRLGIPLRNRSAEPFEELSAVVRSEAPCAEARVVSITGRMDYGTIAPGATSSPLVLVTWYEVVASTRCPTDEPIDIVIELTDRNGSTIGLPVSIPVAEAEREIVYGGHVVDDAVAYAPRNNANGRAEPGETVHLVASLENGGGSIVRGVSATMSSSSSCASTRTVAPGGRIEYGDIAPGATSEGTTFFAYYEVVISTTCEPEESLELVLAVEDASDGRSELPFAVPLTAATSDLVYASHAARDSVAFGPRNNDNGRIEPGETVRLAIGLRNAGSSSIRGVTAALRSESPCALASTVAEGGRVVYGDLAPGASVTPALLFSYFELQLSPSECVAGESIDMVIEATDASDREFELAFRVRTSELDGELTFDGLEIDDSVDRDSDNDGDGRAEPGETVRLAVSLANAGTSLLRDVSATMSSSSDCAIAVTSIGPSGRVRYGDIPAGATDSPPSEQGYDLEIASDCEDDEITATLQARDASNQAFSLPVTIPVS